MNFYKAKRGNLFEYLIVFIPEQVGDSLIILRLIQSGIESLEVIVTLNPYVLSLQA